MKSFFFLFFPPLLLPKEGIQHFSLSGSECTVISEVHS